MFSSVKETVLRRLDSAPGPARPHERLPYRQDEVLLLKRHGLCSLQMEDRSFARQRARTVCTRPATTLTPLPPRPGLAP